MTPYARFGAFADTAGAATLAARLAAWHDAMVAHPRRLRLGRTEVACDDECPHAIARGLWSEAVAAFGARAQELLFLRTSAVGRGDA
jgi:hypothetical protein